MSTRRKKLIFKKIPVDMREHLHEITGNELKVWLYYRLRSGEDDTSYPSNGLVAKETGLSEDTVKTCKRSLRAKGWNDFKPQQRRPDGSWTTATERATFPWMKVSTTVGGKNPLPTVVENTDDGKTHHKVDTDFKVTASTPVATLPPSRPIQILKDSESPSLPGSQSVIQSTPPAAAYASDDIRQNEVSTIDPYEQALLALQESNPWMPRDIRGYLNWPAVIFDFYDRAGSEDAIDRNRARDLVACYKLLDEHRIDEIAFVLDMVLSGRIAYFKKLRLRDFWWFADHYGHARTLAEEALLAGAAQRGHGRFSIRAPWNWRESPGQWEGVQNGSSNLPSWNHCDHAIVVPATNACWDCGAPGSYREDQAEQRRNEARIAQYEWRTMTAEEQKTAIERLEEGWPKGTFKAMVESGQITQEQRDVALLWALNNRQTIVFEEFKEILADVIEVDGLRQG